MQRTVRGRIRRGAGPGLLPSMLGEVVVALVLLAGAGRAHAQAPAAAAPVVPSGGPQVAEGAPVGSDDVHVHVVQRKRYTTSGRHEVALYPVTTQLNGKFTRHLGAALSWAWHLDENLAVQFTPLFNYVNHESAFNAELVDKGRQEAQAASALLLQYGAVAGVEVSPVYGKFAFYQGTLGHFSLVLNAGVGVGSTRIQLQPAQVNDCGGSTGVACRSASFGDTGAKFLGSVGAGLRLALGERLAMRVEVRDLLYTARVDRINGCSYEDLTQLADGLPVGSSRCDAGAFAYPEEQQHARAFLKDVSSDVLNNVTFLTGLSLLF